MDDWTWIDTIQMRMPVLAQPGRLTGKQRYCDKMRQMYSCPRNGMGSRLFSQKEGLWWRGANFIPPYREPNGKNCFRSRGNGWVYAALMRVLDEVPESDTHYMDYIEDFLLMSKALKAYRRVNGS